MKDGFHNKIIKFKKLVSNNIFIYGKRASRNHGASTMDSFQLKQKEKIYAYKRYAFIGNIFFAKPPMLRVGISVDSVINFEEVSDYPIPLGK